MDKPDWCKRKSISVFSFKRQHDRGDDSKTRDLAINMKHFRFEKGGAKNCHACLVCWHTDPHIISNRFSTNGEALDQNAIENKRRACGLSFGSKGSATTTCSPLPYWRGANGLMSCNLFGAATNFLYQEEVEFCSTAGRGGSDWGGTRGRAVNSCAIATPAVIAKKAQIAI
jgi:hypothetical protein